MKPYNENTLPILAWLALANCPPTCRSSALANVCKTTRVAVYKWLDGTRNISPQCSEMIRLAVRPLQIADLQQPHSLRLHTGEMVYHIRSARDEVLLSFDRESQTFHLARRAATVYTYPANLRVGLALVDLSLALLYGF